MYHAHPLVFVAPFISLLLSLHLFLIALFAVIEEDYANAREVLHKRKKLKLVTFNVMMDSWGQGKNPTYNHTEMIYTNIRRPKIYETLGEVNPFLCIAFFSLSEP